MYITKGCSNGKTWYILTCIESDKDDKKKVTAKTNIFITENIANALTSCGIKMYKKTIEEVK